MQVTSKKPNPLSQHPIKYKSRGTWSEFTGNARRLWKNLSQEDLAVREGNYEELIDRIHRISGEDIREIRKKLFHV